MRKPELKLGSGWWSGGPTGLQNQLAELNPRLVGSIPTRSRHLFLLFVIGLTLSPGMLSGQKSNGEEALIDPLPVRPNDLLSSNISARGAFIRSLLIPGWGQSAAGSPGRGAFYFGIEGASLWMLLKTFNTLDNANVQLTTVKTATRKKLQFTNGLSGADLDQAVLDNSVVKTAAELVEDRSQQREDWMAVSLFFLFFGAADAFVTAHLENFPAPLETKISTSTEMGVGLHFSLFLDLLR